MEVEQGWNTEYGREKFRVSVNDGDFDQLCAEYGITGAYRDRATVRMKFLVLDTFCRWLSLREQMREVPAADQEGARVRVQQAWAVHEQAVANVKKGLGMPPDELVHPPAEQREPAPAA